MCSASPRYYICVYASQVAMCIGENRHKNVSDAVMMMWQRIAPASFRQALHRNNCTTDEERLRALMDVRGDVRALVSKSMTSAISSAEVSSCYANAQAELEKAHLDREERRLVDDALRKNLYTSYGTHAESEMFVYIRDVLRIPCRTDSKFYKRHMGTVDGIPWYVGGKIDAISEDGDILIEIKNRVNRLFMRAPSYEVAQVQAYLELLDVDQGIIVECLKDSQGVHTNTIPLLRDRRYWEMRVVPKLTHFVSFLVRLLDDTALQDAFLNSKKPSAMLSATCP